MWQQEPRRAPQPKPEKPLPTLEEAWETFCAEPRALRRLATIGFGTMALSMQDVLLEPYGGQILHLSVSQTTLLTAALASGGLTGLAVASRRLARGADPFRIAAVGLLTGLAAFVSVIASAGLNFPPLFAAGVFLIGFSSGLFLVGTLSDAMSRAKGGMSGLALGAWGSVQAVAAGSAIAIGGILRDYVGNYGGGAASGYDAVYLLEIILIFVTLVALGPLVRRGRSPGFALHQPIKT
jgi:BCD family chlorophyll transporter-like MFS transporter